MAFLKFANAVVVKPLVGKEEWTSFRNHRVASEDFQEVHKKGRLHLANYHPDEYLLTHATIIASVDVEEAQGVRLGEVIENNRKVYRPRADYYITPDTAKYVNCNNDAFSRDVVMQCYGTFRGAENYVEHVQIPELSKGKVIDAVARDLGDTVYVDILVATHKIHTDLIDDINSGELNSLSMGCQILHSTCSKCGNRAKDDVELSDHIKYEKGQTFIDENGVERVIAELCGSPDDSESVVYIEASWVANPAFKGAVTRSILNPENFEFLANDKELQRQIMEAFTLANNRDASAMDAFLKCASMVKEKQGFGFGGDSEPAPAPPKKMLDLLTDELYGQLKNRVLRRMQDELREELSVEEPAKAMTDAERAPNDSIIHASGDVYASEIQDPHLRGEVYAGIGYLKGASQEKVSTKALVTAMYLLDRDAALETASKDLYSCLLRVGPVRKYKSARHYLAACAVVMKRRPSKKEATFLVMRGQKL